MAATKAALQGGNKRQDEATKRGSEDRPDRRRLLGLRGLGSRRVARTKRTSEGSEFCRCACRRGGFFSGAKALCGDSRAEGLWPPKGTTAAEHSEPPQHAAAAGGGLQGLAHEARRREPKE